MKKIYLAGPDVFLPGAIEVGRRKQELCNEFGFEGLFPLDKDEEVGLDSTKIFSANCELMRMADIGLFNLTPFRGPSADVGTVFELGYMFGMEKLLLGYTSGSTIFLDRVEITHGAHTDEDGRKWDNGGFAIENFGLIDNLMIDGAILKSGGTIAHVSEEGPGALAALHAFKLCLSSVAKRVG